MVPQKKTHQRRSAVALAAGLFGLAGCVSVAPLEPIKNPPTYFRSDNTVAVEFLSPAVVGVRCAERGTAFFGMPVFHAMACGNGKLITMPEACSTFTGGAYAALVCDTRKDVKALRDTVSPFLMNASFIAGKVASVDTAETADSDDTYKVEFVHPAAVAMRCSLLGATVRDGDEEDLRSCATPERMVLPNPCMSLEAGWYPRTLCHEMAHANGWAMDHPGGSFQSDKKAGVDPADVPPPQFVMAALNSSAPLRKASESPTYLAYAAAKGLPDIQYASLAQPAVLSAAPEAAAARAPSALSDMFGALRNAQTSVPAFFASAKTLLVEVSGPGAVAQPSDQLAERRKRPVIDLMTTARLYQASLDAKQAPVKPPHIRFAALQVPEPVIVPSLANGPVFDVAATTQAAELPVSELAMVTLEPTDLPLEAPIPDATIELAAIVPEPVAPATSPASHTGLVLRRKSDLLAGMPSAALEETETPAGPGAPSFKPDVQPLWRDAVLSTAAGV